MATDGVRSYKVRWSGYTKKHDSWVPEADITAPELLDRFRQLRLQQKQNSTNEEPDSDEEEEDEDSDETIEYPPEVQADIAPPPRVSRSGRVLRERSRLDL